MCGCRKNVPPVPKYVWTSSDGKQTASNLTKVQANALQSRKGGEIKPA